MTGSPQLHFSRHARNRMPLWKVLEMGVRDALQQPEDVTPSCRGRKNAWKRRGYGWLGVTYVEEARGLAVVTVTPLEKKPRGRRR